MNFINVLLCLCGFTLYALFHNISLASKYPLINLCEVEKCPLCYGIESCEEFKSNKFEVDSFKDIVYNYFNKKSMYQARYENRSVVLKRLASNDKLNEIDKSLEMTYTSDLNDKLISFPYEHSIHIANIRTIKLWMDTFQKVTDGEQLYFYYLLAVNVEPLILMMQFKSTPHYLGACGRMIILDNWDSTLNDFLYADWFTRANLSLQLLDAAKDFTIGRIVEEITFRVYLTNISPDDISIDSNMNIMFTDIGNSIILNHDYAKFFCIPETTIKYKDKFSEVKHKCDFINISNIYWKYENYEIYISSDIKGSNNINPENFEKIKKNRWIRFSDLNYYVICKLLLSKEAPSPMVKGGLLHSPPPVIQERFPVLFELIEQCVHPDDGNNRFDVSMSMEHILKEILILYQ